MAQASVQHGRAAQNAERQPHMVKLLIALCLYTQVARVQGVDLGFRGGTLA